MERRLLNAPSLQALTHHLNVHESNERGAQ
jgi:hypothetical protein